jgi:hypothetical protein
MPLLLAQDQPNPNGWLQSLLETVATVQHQKEAEAQAAADAADREKRAAANEHYLTLALQQKNDFEFASLALEKEKVALLKEASGPFDPSTMGFGGVTQPPVSVPSTPPAALPTIPESTPGNFSASGAPPAATGGFEFGASAQTPAESLMAAVGPSIPMPTTGPNGQPLSPRARLGLRNTLGEADALPSGGPDAGALALFPQSSPVNEMAALANNLRGIPKKVAFPALAAAAKQIATTAAKGGSGTDLLAGMEPVPEHNTVRDPKTGIEYFASQDSSGKQKLLPYRPKELVAKIFGQGSDGKIYAYGSNGEPMQPIPDGVTVEKNPGRIQTTKDNTGNVFELHRDSTVSLLIPAHTKLLAKEREHYMADAQSEAAARAEYETQKAAVDQNGAGWFGLDKKKLGEAETSWKEAKTKLETWHKQYPELATGQEPAAAPAVSASDKDAALAAARAAITAGKDPAAVKKRLEENGIDSSTL